MFFGGGGGIPFMHPGMGFPPGMGGMGGGDDERGAVDNEKMYAILGVAKTATQGEIKKAYMKLAKEVRGW
jgi:hypothetical protein